MTPRGVVESRRLPGSGAGPSPDRLFLGAEGILGVITEAWMRLQDRPRFRASATARFPSFEQESKRRALAQSGLHPSNCRLLDATEALVTGTDDGWRTCSDRVRVRRPPAGRLARATSTAVRPRCRCRTARARTRTDDSTREGSAGAWRSAFLRAPYREARS